MIGAAIMLIGGSIAWFFGVDAEGKSLEDIASPLSAVTASGGGMSAEPNPA